MVNLKVQCLVCGKELQGNSGKTHSCGCPNMMTVIGDSITASNLSQTIIVRRIDEKKEKDKLTSQDLEWQEQRRKRKVRKLDFETR